ncbi:hypothetical protein ACE7GA_26290 [Roseomonas sp. CCTCC AB2023176]|uniref:hypothetical protein n=1 Tax=Roseomonas sp. CCTCC AB2023176 TaxID=3342640 RepID=UPI0035E28467
MCDDGRRRAGPWTRPRRAILPVTILAILCVLLPTLAVGREQSRLSGQVSLTATASFLDRFVSSRHPALPLSIVLQGNEAGDPFFARLSFSGSAGQTDIDVASGGSISAWRASGMELLPPNRNPRSAFVDDVFQIVVARPGAQDEVRAGQDAFFLHQAGTYRLRQREDSPQVFSPALGVQSDPQGGTLYLLAWPQAAHLPSAIRSEFLILSRLRRVAPDVLEYAALIVNFGCESSGWLSFPWGGVRTSALPQLHLGSETGETRVEPRLRYGEGPVVGPSDWNGIALWSADHAREERPALGLAVPTRFGASPGIWRSGVGGGGTAGEPRDFYVGASEGGIVLEPGDAAVGWFYIGVGRPAELEASLRHLRAAAPPEVRRLAAGETRPEPTRCLAEENGLDRSGRCRITVTDTAAPGLRPLFRYRRPDGTSALTDDPYLGVPVGLGLETWRRVGEIEAVVGFVGTTRSGGACNLTSGEVCEATVTPAAEGRCARQH